MKPRPLSPHLQIYRPQITSVLSSCHRLSGFGLVFSLLFFMAGVASLAMGESAYLAFMGFMGTGIGQAIVCLSLFAFFYHLANGIRHLTWDYGYGYELSTVHRSGWIVVGFALVATLGTWILGH
jgi:succinate dehydrogenase / fumarate reductase, cytochrome b subunit